MSLPIYPLCFPEREQSGKLRSYGLYRRVDEEHITPIQRIPETSFTRSGGDAAGSRPAPRGTRLTLSVATARDRGFGSTSSSTGRVDVRRMA